MCVCVCVCVNLHAVVDSSRKTCLVGTDACALTNMGQTVTMYKNSCSTLSCYCVCVCVCVCVLREEFCV